mgnify:CR=1 FL=1
MVKRSEVRVVIVPGNGCSPVEYSNWYSWARDRFALMLSPDRVLLEDMPDAMDAHESVWVPHLRDKMQCGPNTIVVGHSSGAVAAMRLLEETPLLGVVLVAACHTDLGCEHEREAGYYDRPWQWDKIKENAGWIVQFHSRDDFLIPVEEADHVAKMLGSDYRVFQDRVHFFDPFEELMEVVEERLQALEEEDKGR